MPAGAECPRVKFELTTGPLPGGKLLYPVSPIEPLTRYGVVL